MPKFRVSGPITVYVTTEVEVTEEELMRLLWHQELDDFLIEKACDTCCVSNFCGNGGADKLIGVVNSNGSISCEESYIEFDTVEKVEE